MKKYSWLIILLLTVNTIQQKSVYGDASNKKNILPHNEITVGIKDADVIGSDNKAIQLAIDALSYRGGGIVRILPGEYILENSR